MGHTKSTLDESVLETLPLKQNHIHHIHHLIHIILFKLLWEFRESPKVLLCVTKLHKGLGR